MPQHGHRLPEMIRGILLRNLTRKRTTRRVRTSIDNIVGSVTASVHVFSLPEECFYCGVGYRFLLLFIFFSFSFLSPPPIFCRPFGHNCRHRRGPQVPVAYTSLDKLKKAFNHEGSNRSSFTSVVCVFFLPWTRGLLIVRFCGCPTMIVVRASCSLLLTQSRCS